MKISAENKVIEIGDVIYNKSSERYMRIISHQGKFTWLFLDTFTTSSLSFRTIENLVNHFEDDDIIVYKKNDMELILN